MSRYSDCTSKKYKFKVSIVAILKLRLLIDESTFIIFVWICLLKE